MKSLFMILNLEKAALSLTNDTPRDQGVKTELISKREYIIRRIYNI